MDYQIGSLADLISGTNTPKKEIIKTVYEPPVKAKIQKSVDSKGADHKKDLKRSAQPPTLSKNKRKKLRRLAEQEQQSLNDNTDECNTKADDGAEPENNEPEEENADTEENDTNMEDKAGDEEDNKITETDIFNNEELKKRTIFVGNLPNTLKKSHLKKLFLKYGEIQSVRFRSAPIADVRTSKKVAVIKQEFHPNRTNINGFVCFKNEESATKAVEANGTLVKEHHLRVDLAINEKGMYDNTKAIFIGNLDFSTEEDDLWSAFADCGTIESVRVVRDKKTNMGKGFGYVNFSTSDAVELAVKLDGTEIKGRAVRIKRIQLNPTKRTAVAQDNSKKPYNIKKRDAFGNKNRNRENRNLKRQAVANGEPTEKKDKPAEPPAKHTVFQGAKSEKKKKKHVNKGELIKKKLVKQLAPKPKSETKT